MSRTIRSLLASTAVALAASLLPTATFADDDDWEDYLEDQEEAWEDYHKSLRRHNHYHRPGSYGYHSNGWYGTHGGYGASPYHYNGYQYGQPYYYGYGGQPYGYAQPYWGGSNYGYGGCGYYGRRRGGFHLHVR